MKPTNGKIIVITSGKGGVGKTTTAAAIGAELARKNHKTIVVDFDIGLRNLDLMMGCERRVVYDFINVIQQEANLNQAIIKDKRCEQLFILPASQTRNKNALTKEGVFRVLSELKTMFEYIICDSPAGIEHGAQMALHWADEAIIVTNPEISSIRDSDRMIGVLNSESALTLQGQEITKHLLITRFCPTRAKQGEMLAIADVQDILAIPMLGVIPESKAILTASNQGIPITLEQPNPAKTAYQLAVATLQGKPYSEQPIDSRWGFLRNLNFFRGQHEHT